MSDSKRQHERHDLGLTIDVGGHAESSVNISAGGISVDGTYEVGESLRVTFAIRRSGLLVHTEGRIVWSEEGRSGLIFDDLDPETRAALDEVLTRVEP